MVDNQTNEIWLRLPTVAEDSNALGTGVYLEKFGEVKNLRNGVKYDQFVNEADKNQWAAFAWIPDLVATFDQIKDASCSGQRCSKTCKIPGCICDLKIGICK